MPSVKDNLIAARARRKLQWDYDGAECWEGCTDPDCPYTHPRMIPARDRANTSQEQSE